MRIISVDDMQRVEAATDDSGHSYASMMDKAGRAVADAVLARQAGRGLRVLVLVGPGNNGGDGLVAARYLAEAGAEVACYLSKARGDDDPNLQAVRDLELLVADAKNDKRWRVLRQLVSNADVIIDALLGTGIQLPLKGVIADLLAKVREGLKTRKTRRSAARTLITPDRPEASPPVPLIVAVDGPSGLNYDTGELDPLALSADLTVTFAYPKKGHYVFPGAAARGGLIVADIGVEPKQTSDLLGDPTLEVATPDMIGPLLPQRPLEAHKGTFGKALLVVGSINYTGAAYLAASGASRVGAGLVTLAVPSAIHTALAAKISEATFLIVPQVMGVIAPAAVALLMDRMAEYQAILLGPGLTQEKEAVEFVSELFRVETLAKRTGRIGFQVGGAPDHVDRPDAQSPFPPLVVDADALNALVQTDEKAWWHRLPAPAVLTPHPGEMARLMGARSSDVQADRLGVAQAKAAEWGHIVVLKGAHTIVASPDGHATVVPFATPALATAGSGDVLAGAIVGLLAQGLAPFSAAVVSVYLHGLAGSWASEEIGSAGTIASDLLLRLPRAIRALVNYA